MFQFGSCLEIADETMLKHHSNDELLERFNNYCEHTNNSHNKIYYNGDEFLSMFTKAEIADYATYKYRLCDDFVRVEDYGFVSANDVYDLINNSYEMDAYYLQNEDYELKTAYDLYLQSLVKDEVVSMEDWVENILHFYDGDKEEHEYDVNSFPAIMKIFSSHFSEIYHHSSEKQIQHAKEIIEERTDIFPDDFIEANL